MPGLGRYPGEGNSNLLQHSCLGNPMGYGKKNFFFLYSQAGYIVHGVTIVGYNLVSKPPQVLIFKYCSYIRKNSGKYLC